MESWSESAVSQKIIIPWQLLQSWWTKPPNPNAHQVLQQWPDLLCGQTDLCPGSRMMLTKQGNTVFNENKWWFVLICFFWVVEGLTKWQTKWVLNYRNDLQPWKWRVFSERIAWCLCRLFVLINGVISVEFLVGFGFRRSPWVFSFEYSTCWEVLIILELLSWWLF